MSAAAADRLLDRALDEPTVRHALAGDRVYVVAAGKASGPMVSALQNRMGERLRRVVVAGTGNPPAPAPRVRWFAAGHPEPNAASVAAGQAALDLAKSIEPDDLLIVLLSGGASATLAVPLPGLSLADKQAATRLLLAAGADITSLNTVRKHLSAIKGGRLAAAARGRILTLVVSDVVGDDVSVVGSGPTCRDPTTFEDALQVLERLHVRADFPASALKCLSRGAQGELEETLKGDLHGRGVIRVIGGRLDAIEGARHAAEALGYAVAVLDEPVTGEARVAAATYVGRVATRLARYERPVCILSAGETTVTVTGRGMGGRNQEFALAAAGSLGDLGARVAVASVGTDGVDGPTPAAGAVIDSTSLDRARAAGLASTAEFLADNDSYRFFDALGDLVVTGPTRTNVGDIQVALVAE